MIAPELEESVHLSDVYGRRKSQQIVLPGRIRVTPEITWSLTRTGFGQKARAKASGRDPAGGPDLFTG
jgi:hypothetical protein